MAYTIEEIREYCITVDLDNVLDGDASVGAYGKGQKFIQFKDERDIRLFYLKISLSELLDTFSSYNGLEYYRADEPEDYKQSYSVDVLSVLDYIKYK